VHTVAPDGVKLAVEVSGEGEPVSVFAHGLTGNRADFRLITEFLPGTRVLFDFRGHGESDLPGAGSYSTEHFASDLDAVARDRGATCAGGISLGAGAILRLLSHDPHRFDKLVLIQPARLDRSSEAHRRMFRLAGVLERLPLDQAVEEILEAEAAEGAFDEWAGQRDLRRAALLSLHPESIPYAIRECIDDPPLTDGISLRAVTAPALVIAHEGDPIHDADVARDLADALPNAELAVFGSYRELLENTPALVQRVAALLSS
jgi:pimeloyl-ACP methyl ester carboxylesterase